MRKYTSSPPDLTPDLTPIQAGHYPSFVRRISIVESPALISLTPCPLSHAKRRAGERERWAFQKKDRSKLKAVRKISHLK
jgi:hypothetical protein